MTYVDLDPDDYRPVQVQTDDGLWVDGWLEAYRKAQGVWSGYVRYSDKPNENRIGWFDESRLRSG